MFLQLEVEEVLRLQVILEEAVYPSELQEEGLLVKEAEGVEIHQGMGVDVVEHFLTLLDAVVGQHLRGQVAVGVLLIHVWVELVALEEV